jgi:hypothetical protein
MVKGSVIKRENCIPKFLEVLQELEKECFKRQREE